MKLVLLGTTGYHPNGRRQTACLMLPEVGVILDAGTGIFRAGKLLRTKTLDIYLTHAHLDHVIGLTFLFDVLAGKQPVSVRVHGAAEKLVAIDTHLFAPDLFPARPPFEWRPLQSTNPLPGGGQLASFPLDHPGGSLGFRLDWPGHSLAYVTDTTARPDALYVAAIHGVDLLVHECNFTDEQADWAEKTGHSCLTPVLQIAAAARVKRLILTHFDSLSEADDPVGLAAKKHLFPAAEIGSDGQEVEF